MRANRFLGSGGTLNKVFNCATLSKITCNTTSKVIYFNVVWVWGGVHPHGAPVTKRYTVTRGLCISRQKIFFFFFLRIFHVNIMRGCVSQKAVKGCRGYVIRCHKKKSKKEKKKAKQVGL